MAGNEAPSASSAAPSSPSSESPRDQVSSGAPRSNEFPQILPVPQAAASASSAARGRTAQPQADGSVSRGGAAAAVSCGGDGSTSSATATGSRTRGSVTACGIKVLSLPEASRSQKQTLSRPDVLSRHAHQYVDIRELRKAVASEPGPLILPPPGQVGAPVPAAVPTPAWPGLHDVGLSTQKGVKSSEGIPTGFFFPSELNPSPSSLAGGIVTFASPDFFPATVSGLAASTSMSWPVSVGISAGGRGHAATTPFAAPPGAAAYPLSHARIPGGDLVYYLTAGVVLPGGAGAGVVPAGALGAGTILPPGATFLSHASAGENNGGAMVSAQNARVGDHVALAGKAKQGANAQHNTGGGSENPADGQTSDAAGYGEDGRTGEGGKASTRVPRLIAHVALMQQLMPSFLDERPAHQLQGVEALNALLLHSKKTLFRWLEECGSTTAAASSCSASRCPDTSSSPVGSSTGMETQSLAFSGGSIPPPGLDCLFLSVRVSLLHLIAGGLLTSAEVAARCAAIRCLALLAHLAAAGAVFAGPATLAAPRAEGNKPQRQHGDLPTDAAKIPALVLGASRRAREELAAQTQQGKKSIQEKSENDGPAWTEAELEACEGASTIVRCCLILLAHMTGDCCTMGRLAALSALTSLVPFISQEMALACLQRPLFPPTTSSPLARLRTLLRTDLEEATSRARKTAEVASEQSLLAEPSASGDSVSSPWRLAGIAGTLAGEGERAHRSHHTVAGQELQTRISQLPLPVGWLLLSLDDNNFRVRQSAFVLLRRLLESYTRDADALKESEKKTQQGSNSFTQTVQLLIWDYLSDPVQVVQAAAAAILPPLSLTIPLRDGAFRRAIFPLLQAKEKSTRMIFLRILPLCKTLNARGRKVEVQGLLRCPYSREDEHEVAACFAEVVFAAYHGLWDKIAGRGETGGRAGGDQSSYSSEARKKELEMLHVFRIFAPASRRKRTQLALATNWGRREWELRLLPLMRRDAGAAGAFQKLREQEAEHGGEQEREHTGHLSDSEKSRTCFNGRSPAGRPGRPAEGDEQDAVPVFSGRERNVSRDREGAFLSPFLLLKKEREEEDNRLTQVLPLDVQLSIPETALQFSLAFQRVLPTHAIERQLAAADCLLSHLHLEEEDRQEEGDFSADETDGRPDPGGSCLAREDADGGGASGCTQVQRRGSAVGDVLACARRDSDMSVEPEREAKKGEDSCLDLALAVWLRRRETRFPRPATRRRSFSRLFCDRGSRGAKLSLVSLLDRRPCFQRPGERGTTSEASPTLLNDELWRLLHSEIPCRAGTCRQALRSIRPVLAFPLSFPFSPFKGSQIPSQRPLSSSAKSLSLDGLFSFEDEEERLFRFVERRARKVGSGLATPGGRSPTDRSLNRQRKSQVPAAQKSEARGPTGGGAFERPVSEDPATVVLPLLPSPSLADALVLAVLQRERGRERTRQRAKRERDARAEAAYAQQCPSTNTKTLASCQTQEENLGAPGSGKRPRLSLFSFSVNAKLSAKPAVSTSQEKREVPFLKGPSSSSLSSSSSCSSSSFAGVLDSDEGSLRPQGVPVRHRHRASGCFCSSDAPVRAQLAIRASAWATQDSLARAKKRSLSPVCFSFLLEGQRKRRRGGGGASAGWWGLAGANGDSEERGLWEEEDESSWRTMVDREGPQSETAIEPLAQTLELRPPVWSSLCRMLCREALLREQSMLAFALFRFRRPGPAGCPISKTQLRSSRSSSPSSSLSSSPAASSSLTCPSVSSPPTGCLSLSSLARIYVKARRSGASASSLAASLPRSFCVWRNVLVSSRLQAIAATALLASPSLVISPPDLLPHSRLLGLLSRSSFQRDFACGDSPRDRADACAETLWEANSRCASRGHSYLNSQTHSLSSSPCSLSSLSSLSFPFVVSLECPNWEVALEVYIHQSVIASTGLAALLPLEGGEGTSEGRTLARSSCSFSPFFSSSGALALSRQSPASADMSRLLLAEALAGLVPRPLRFSCSRGAVVWLEATVDVLFADSEEDWERESVGVLRASTHARGGAESGLKVPGAAGASSWRRQKLCAAVRELSCVPVRTFSESKAEREEKRKHLFRETSDLVLCVKGTTALRVESRAGQPGCKREERGTQFRDLSAFSPSRASSSSANVEKANAFARPKAALERLQTATPGAGREADSVSFSRQTPSLLVRAVLAGTTKSVRSSSLSQVDTEEERRNCAVGRGPGPETTSHSGVCTPEGDDMRDQWSRWGDGEHREDCLSAVGPKQKRQTSGVTFSSANGPRAAYPSSRVSSLLQSRTSLDSCCSASECIGGQDLRSVTSSLDSRRSAWNGVQIRRKPSSAVLPTSTVVVPLFASGAELASSPPFAGRSQSTRERRAAQIGVGRPGTASGRACPNSSCPDTAESDADRDESPDLQNIGMKTKRIQFFRVHEVEKLTGNWARARVTFPLCMDAATSGPFPVDLVVCVIQTGRVEHCGQRQREASLSTGCTRRVVGASEMQRKQTNPQILVSVSDAKRIWLQPEWV
ncbi:HEAT repeat-containing protein [Toxoplasma gondii ME49]|uniref:HEAT repeat-containing protein n=1 Tax=Toxoplasma gondii (strain ATCC 50611 / Me49) TaxID=508771 RepID=S8GHX9_TOXGM|nr:HEAT repeat-containing protein [Toxoplasma gondii ME49]EPT28059.1 HEAT repeat-containing protein [Toxoplasma gondii ME49]|eukprot:XP_018636454.1 HEAT repeat-containing protein [Toxoplasma gondii ME49]